jgi:hypothetical protein
MQQPEPRERHDPYDDVFPAATNAAGDYNLVATFPDAAAARRAAGALLRRGVGEESMSLRDAGDAPGVDEARMRDELEGSLGGVATKSMTIGALVGGILGGVAGVILGFIVGVLAFGSGATNVGMWTTVIVLAVAFSTAGAVAGGFVKPRSEPDAVDVPGSPGGAAAERQAAPSDHFVALEIHVEDPRSFAEAEEALQEAGPLRVDRFTDSGRVVGTEGLGLNAPPVQPGSGRTIPERFGGGS